MQGNDCFDAPSYSYTCSCVCVCSDGWMDGWIYCKTTHGILRKKKREFTLAKKRIMPSEKIPIALTAAIAAL